MPNTEPPVLTAQGLMRYRQEILASARASGHDRFMPLMTIQITENTTPETIRAAKAAGAIAGKLYPQGVTTNSNNGVLELDRLFPVFEVMADPEIGMVLCIHAQEPWTDHNRPIVSLEEMIERNKQQKDAIPQIQVLGSEAEFLNRVEALAHHLPKLKIVIEHMSTRHALQMTSDHENLAGTLTLHHLLLSLDDLIGWRGSNGHTGLNPDHFCQPVVQSIPERESLLHAARGDNTRIFLGSDSAPHTRERKKGDCGCAGIFSAPVLLPALVQLFESHNSLNKLAGFASTKGADFYGLPPNEGEVILRKVPWRVPEDISIPGVGTVKPFLAGIELAWQVVGFSE